MKVHFIAIGGSAMHNMAIALHKKGLMVSGSDDEIFDPSASRLKKYGLLPDKWGWFPEKITPELDAIILGMHARENNPELQKAREHGIKIYSYPEYIYEQTKNKKRVVIGGSHGKTTTTSMVMHVLKENDIEFDYLVGAQLEGFDTMVQLTEKADIAILEGDEYLASPIDRRPKFHLYRPHIALLTGIAWDHINVFPTFDSYLEQFEQFVNLIEDNGMLIYFKKDEHLCDIVSRNQKNIKTIPYETHPSVIENDCAFLLNGKEKIRLNVFGEHNLQNLQGARLVCRELGISDAQFFTAIASFTGAAKRLQILEEKENMAVFMDFAHSPSKLRATTQAVKAQYPKRKLIACMELHTFSSLKEAFLPLYQGAMSQADLAFVYFDPDTVKHKKLKPITIEQVAEAFGSPNLQVFTDSKAMLDALFQLTWNNTNLLLMSSGNFSGIDLSQLAKDIVNTC